MTDAELISLLAGHARENRAHIKAQCDPTNVEVVLLRKLVERLLDMSASLSARLDTANANTEAALASIAANVAKLSSVPVTTAGPTEAEVTLAEANASAAEAAATALNTLANPATPAPAPAA